MRRILIALLALITLLLPLAAECEEGYEEHPMVSEGLKVYGRFYTPEGTEGPWPTVILSHGFGGTWEESKLYIPLFLERGVACYVFDFPGGAAKNQSEGSFLEMSVLTEKQHLLNIIDEVCAMPQVDKVMLLGFSQGGVVTGLAAVERAEQIVGEVLFYPALCISDDGHAAYGEKENIPDDPKAFWQTVGRIYFEDVWDLDLTGMVTAYDGPVLMFHGTNDPAVNHSYSVRAVELFHHGELVLLSRIGHGFAQQTVNRVFPEIVRFMNAVGLTGVKE